MCIIENISVQNYELLESVAYKISIPNTAMEYWQKKIPARGARKEEN